MTKEQNNLQRLIILSKVSEFTRATRRLHSLNYHHINLILTIYILSLTQDNIYFTDIVKYNTYIDNKRTKLILPNLIPEYVEVYEGRFDCYRLTDRGIGLVDDILNNYDTVFRSILEKHKLNELFI